MELAKTVAVITGGGTGIGPRPRWHWHVRVPAESS